MVIFFALFIAACLFQLIVWVGVFNRVGTSDQLAHEDRTEHQPAYRTTPPNLPAREEPCDNQASLTANCILPVSVIICFRNEAERLRQYLPIILKQDHPDFEVIAVDDFSTDHSVRVVKEIALHYPSLRLVTPPKPTRPGKKDALTFGISQAKNEVLLLTDADCAPAHDQWIREMTAGFFGTKIEVILGYSPYRYNSSSVNGFQRYETVYTALQYFGFARAGMPYMGVGRNLAYRKNFFLRAGGLSDHAHLPGGDDDLLISHHAKATTTAWVIDKAAWTLSNPASSWRDYLSRKFRHLGVGGHYPFIPKLLLGGLGASHIGVYLLGIIGLFSTYALVIFLLLVVRAVVVIFVIKSSPFTDKLPEARPFSVSSIIYNDFLLAIYYLVLLPAPLLDGRHKGGW